MNWDEYYKKHYDKSREEIQDLLFQFGWVRGNLHRLQKYLDSGLLKTDDYTMNLLRDVANCLETADVALTEHKAKMAELTELAKSK